MLLWEGDEFQDRQTRLNPCSGTRGIGKGWMKRTESVTEQARIKDRTRLVGMRTLWCTRQLFWECNRQKSRCSILPAAPNRRAPQATYLRVTKSDSRSLYKGKAAGTVTCESLNLKQTLPERLQPDSSLVPAADVQKSTRRWWETGKNLHWDLSAHPV